MKRHYIITMNDLKEEKQESIKKDLVKYLDDKTLEDLEKKVQKAMDRTWVEWEVEL